MTKRTTERIPELETELQVWEGNKPGYCSVCKSKSIESGHTYYASKNNPNSMRHSTCARIVPKGLRFFRDSESQDGSFTLRTGCRQRKFKMKTSKIQHANAK